MAFLFPAAMPVASFLLAMGIQVSAAFAQDVSDRVGKYVGCQEDSGINPYCFDPEIRAMVYEQFRLKEILDDVEFDVAKANLVGAQMRSTQNNLMLAAKRCGADVECLKSALTVATEEMYEISEIDKPDPLTEDEIAAYAAAEAAAIEERPEKQARILELDESYAKEWAAAVPMLDESRMRSFRRKHRDPERWSRDWAKKCGSDVVCLDEKIGNFKAMVAARDKARAETQASRQEIAKRKHREFIAEQAAIAKRERLKAEKIRREKAMQEMIVIASEEARDKLSPESVMYHVFFEDFARADAIASRIVRTVIYEQDYALMDKLVPQQFRGTARYKIMENRRNLVVADYALTRAGRLGNCGESVELITWQKTEEKVFRNGLGQTIVLPAQYARFYVPSKFARYARRTHLEKGERMFLKDVDAIGDCDSALRVVLENRLIEFANWQP